jgi:hypothetical protein
MRKRKLSSISRWWVAACVDRWTPLIRLQDLGLGVLEEKDPDADDSSASEGDDSDAKNGKKEKDVLGKLMGRKSMDRAVNVQEVHDTRKS